MPTIHLSPTELEALARENGWSLSSLCEAAKIAPSNFTRWKSGANGMTIRIHDRLFEIANKKRATAPAEAAE